VHSTTTTTTTNNNNNNIIIIIIIINVTHKAQIRAVSKCAMLRVNVKQKCFQSLPEGTQAELLKYIV